MVFGRKKKEPEVVEEPQDDNQLDLAYGNNEGYDDVSSEEGDSLPPPPPGATSKQNLSHDDSHTIEDSPSIEANDVGISMLSDPDSSTEEKKEPDQNRRKKMLIIFACLASFIILLGLAIKYGSYHKQSKSSASSGLDDMDVGGSFDSPIPDDEEEDVTMSIPEENTNDNVPVVQETIEDVGPNVTEQTGTSIGVDTIPGNSTDSEKTIVPTIDSSEDVTEVATTIGTSDGTSDITSDGTSDASVPNTDIGTGVVTTDRSTSNDDARPTEVTDDSITGDNGLDEFTEAECVDDEIFASSSCENGVTSASISMCIAEEISDQFWAWIEIPQAAAPFQERDWGWIREGTDREITGLPEGRYVLGLYSNGGEVMNEYPLIASSEFIIMCN